MYWTWYRYKFKQYQNAMSKLNSYECRSKWTNSSKTIWTNKECAKEAKRYNQLTLIMWVLMNILHKRWYRAESFRTFKDKQGGKRIIGNEHNFGTCNNIMKREQMSLRELLENLISRIIEIIHWIWPSHPLIPKAIFLSGGIEMVNQVYQVYRNKDEKDTLWRKFPKINYQSIIRLQTILLRSLCTQLPSVIHIHPPDPSMDPQC